MSRVEELTLEKQEYEKSRAGFGEERLEFEQKLDLANMQILSMTEEKDRSSAEAAKIKDTLLQKTEQLIQAIEDVANLRMLYE